jgi:thiol-disulfide isomerase/thioredoxin
MRSGPAILFLVLALIPQSGVTSGLDGAIDACAELESGPERDRCFDRALDSTRPTVRDLRTLERRVGSSPGLVLEVLDAARRVAGEGDDAPVLQAYALDLRGQAQKALGRYDAAAESFARAVALDDGARRLTWISPGTGVLWTAALDTGERRLERAAQNLLDAGRAEASADLLARALALGADGELERAWSALGRGAPPGRDTTAVPLLARDWFIPVPDLDVRNFEERAYSLVDDGRGKVVVLSFWATWCEPCVQELPALQALLDAERDRGLDVLAINVGESAEIALPFMRWLELSLPVGIADRPLREAFDVKSLPVVALVDRSGRVRLRWDGYKPGLEDRIAARARELLAEESPPSTEVATVLSGGARMRVEWLREARARVEGIALLPRSEGGARGLLAGDGRSLVQYDALGRIIRTIKTPVSVGRLRVAETAEDGFEVLSFRPGSRELLTLHLPGGVPEEGSVDTPVFDAAALSGGDEETAPAFLLAALGGLLRHGGGEKGPGRVGEFDEGANSVVVLGPASPTRTAILDLSGRVRWLDESGGIVGESRAPAGAWSLIGGAATGAGVGVAPAGVTASAIGRFLDVDEPQAAVATAAGQLLILGVDSGRTLLRLRWDGVTALAAGDLLADGRDELAVAAGRHVAVLTAGDAESLQ